MDWQERITRETPPATRVEHDLRYALAAPLLRGAPVWLDLGCGVGLAAADALAGEGPERAVLVDADADAVAEAARAVPAGEALPLVADLASDDGLAAVREALGTVRGGVATCFEVIEHLERFIGAVELLVELAETRDFTVLLSIPNDAFWPVESPWHATMWGEGSFEELRRLLPADHVVARQVPLQGSAIVLDGAPPAAPGDAAAQADAVPSHFIAAFGPQTTALAPCAAVTQADLAAQRRWERTREANLAFAEATLETTTVEWRAYIHELERLLGLPLSGVGTDESSPPA
jgi:SAM-dependent methyltransferase